MYVEVVPDNGKSFKGLAAYLLHDPDRAQSDERVAWAETRNLATNDPDAAWRVMAATAMDQGRIKQEAGVGRGGRKDKGSVMHIVLSWKDEEAEARNLSRDEMRRAAIATLKQIGREEVQRKDGSQQKPRQYADEHQAMIICHDEPGKRKHVHIMLNRVHQDHGRMLNPKHDHRALSDWALEYEKEAGKIYCEQRAINAAARARGEFVRGAKKVPRNVYEAEKAANDNTAKAQAIKEELKRKAAELAKRNREIAERHAREWRQMEERHRQRMADAAAEAKRNTTIARDGVRKGYRQSWEMLFYEDDAERAQFNQREQKTFGKVQNAFKAIDFGAIVRGEDRRRAMSEAFQAFGDSGARLEALKKAQNERAQELLAKQRAEEQTAAQRVEWQRQAEQARSRDLFLSERSQLTLAHQMDNAALKAHWRDHAQTRAEKWEPLKREKTRRERLEEWRRYQEQAKAEKREQRSPAPDAPATTTRTEEEPLHLRTAREEEEAKKRAALDPARRRRMEEFLGRAVGRSEEERQAELGEQSSSIDPERAKRIREFLKRGDRAQELRQDREPGDGGGETQGGGGQSM